MSLDVYLTTKETRPRDSSGIFVREAGETREITEDEWCERNPGQQPVRLTDCEETNEVYSANITHNLNKMADEAGLYDCLWRPESVGITKAAQLITPLQKGLDKLCSHRSYFEQFNPANGWGNYDGFVRFVQQYLIACEQHPDADVEVSR